MTPVGTRLPSVPYTLTRIGVVMAPVPWPDIASFMLLKKPIVISPVVGSRG